MWQLDHLAVCAADLTVGRDWAESRLGVAFGPGGEHARFGTHNLLLGMGDLYLEVIAPNPDAVPQAPRWFGLDTPPQTPRLGNWICRTVDLDQALRAAPDQAGRPADLQRGDLRWRIAVPEDGSLPMGGGWPTLIEWGAGTLHPAQRLPDSGLRLRRLIVRHPQAADIAHRLSGLLDDPRITFEPGPTPGLRAEIDSPQGPKVLE